MNFVPITKFISHSNTLPEQGHQGETQKQSGGHPRDMLFSPILVHQQAGSIFHIKSSRWHWIKRENFYKYRPLRFSICSCRTMLIFHVLLILHKRRIQIPILDPVFLPLSVLGLVLLVLPCLQARE